MYLEQKNTKLLLALFVLSLSIRLVALWILPPSHLGTNAEIAYLGGARLIVEGEGLSDPSYPVFTPPLYAIMIAGGLYLFGDDQTPIKIAQAIADSLTVVIIFLISRPIFGPRTAFLASAILTIYPFSIYPVTYIGTETFFTFFLSVFVLLSMYAVTQDNIAYYFSAGVALGLATLTRGTTQYYPVFFLLVLIGLKKVTRSILRGYLAFCLSFMLVIVPWTLRNYTVLQDFIPVATAGGVFLQGSSEKFFTITGKVNEYPKYFEFLKSKGIEAPPSPSKPSEQDRFLIKAGLEKYRIRLENDPLSFVPFMVEKFARLWYATESGENESRILAINIAPYLLAAGGIVLSWKRSNRLAVMLMGVLTYLILLHWISLPLFRYMVPVMPYVICFGAFAIVEIVERFRHKEAGVDGSPGEE